MPRYVINDERAARWERIKALYMAGKSAKEIAEIEGGTANAIYLKAFKQKWPTPNRIRKSLPPEARKPTPAQIQKQQTIAQNEAIIQHSAEVLREKGERGTSKAVDVILKLIEKINPEAIEELGDINAIATALNSLRKATGLDKAEQAVANVNVALFSQGEKPSFRVIED